MTLELIHTATEARKRLDTIRQEGKTVGLVPTMGALHAGHRRMIEEARSECEWLVVSIFVNPLQFGPKEDFDRYPGELSVDLRVCEKLGVDAVFAPEVDEMYPSSHRTSVEVKEITDYLCGHFRPEHFKGVTTVVLKLFHIWTPDRAYFGEKDAQQTAVIRQMVQDLNLPVLIQEMPTVRELDGLAVSSRNKFLDPEHRKAAGSLFQALKEAARQVQEGITEPGLVRQAGLDILEREPLIQVEYFELVDPERMRPAKDLRSAFRACSAVRVGHTRLIDNLLISPASPTTS